jgi:hypothetical protein
MSPNPPGHASLGSHPQYLGPLRWSFRSTSRLGISDRPLVACAGLKPSPVNAAAHKPDPEYFPHLVTNVAHGAVVLCLTPLPHAG